MRLSELTAHISVTRLLGSLPVGEVTGLAYDSRLVTPGALFAALPGVHADGHSFVDAAAERGALAALVERPVPADICQIQVPDARKALAILADAFFGHPTRGMYTVGVTGTNGKTTIAHLVEPLLALLGPVGLLGTVLCRWPGHSEPSALTTPESVELVEYLAAMRAAGARSAVMEVSSHALDQHRADGVEFDVAVFSNLSRDHLDYHGDMDSYFAAKARLFDDLLHRAAREGKDPTAVICYDDPRGAELARQTFDRGIRVFAYGLDEGAAIRGLDPVTGLDGGRLTLSWPGGSFPLTTPLVGRYNLQNLLAAASVGLALGLQPAEIQDALRDARGAPGRLERVYGSGEGPAVFVDYAHTDQALATVLDALRPLTQGRLFCVFGAGGDRDRGKRPLMGRAVGLRADMTVLTSDNPRTEDPKAIIAQVEQGLTETEAVYAVIVDRAKAIAWAISAAEPGDCVLIAGKGHEDYQIVGAQKRHFDDREQAEFALSSRSSAGGGC